MIVSERSCPLYNLSRHSSKSSDTSDLISHVIEVLCLSFVNNLFFTLKQELTPNSRYRQGNRWRKSRKGPEFDAVIYRCLPLFDAAITDKRIRVYVSSHGLSLLADIFSVLLLFFYLIFLLFRFISFFHSIELSLRSFITWRKPETSGARMHAHLGNFQSSLQLFFCHYAR